MTGVRFHPHPFWTWLRGPTRLEEEDVVLDGVRATEYDPLEEPRLWLALTRVQTPADAAQFAARFGLLHAGNPTLKREREYREPVSVFLHHARDLRHLAEITLHVRGAVSGEARAWRALRLAYPLTYLRALPKYADEPIETDDQRYLAVVMDLVTWGLDDGLLDAHLMALNSGAYHRDQVGEIVLGILPQHLRHWCYFQLARVLAARATLAVCAEPTCAQLFEVGHRLQRFCSPTCTQRGRYRRWQERQSTPSQPTKASKGERRGTSRRK